MSLRPADEELPELLVAYNKQRIKKVREILNEYSALEKIHGKGQGRRTDLDTSGKSTKGEVARDIISKKIGVSSSQLARILFIDNENPGLITLIDEGRITINQGYTSLQNGKDFSLYSNISNRIVNDAYETPCSITEHLLRVEPFDTKLSVCEPACGNNAITNVLLTKWKSVVSYDVETNFLLDERRYDYIITNPPYSLSYEFIKQAKKLSRIKFAFLLPITYLHGKQRYEEVYTDKSYGLKNVYVFTMSGMLGDKLREDGKYRTGMQCYGWYIFQNGFCDEPIIRWIDNSEDVLRTKKECLKMRSSPTSVRDLPVIK